MPMPRFTPIFLLPVLALAQVAPAQPLPDRAPLSGVALDSKGRPLGGALLTLRRKNDGGSFAFWGGTALADADGKWSFPDAEEGDYFLNVEAPGFAPLQNREVNWKTGAPPLQIRLARLMDVTLQLRAPDGAPVADALVYARLKPADANAQIQRTALSDGAGNFVLSGVTPGTYALYVRAPQSYATPDAVVVGDENAPVNLRVALQKAGALRVVVSDDKGRALGGAALTLSAESPAINGDLGEDFGLLASGGDRNALVSRDGDGTIEVGGLPPGIYTPRLYLPGYAPVSLASIAIKAGATSELEVKLPARQTPTLTLDVRTLGDKPYTAGEVKLRILPLADNGSLGGGADDLPFFPGGPGGRRAVPDANGRVVLFPVKAGRYRIFAQSHAPVPDRNTADAAPVDVTITPQGATATVIMPKEG